MHPRRRKCESPRQHLIFGVSFFLSALGIDRCYFHVFSLSAGVSHFSSYVCLILLVLSAAVDSSLLFLFLLTAIAAPVFFLRTSDMTHAREKRRRCAAFLVFATFRVKVSDNKLKAEKRAGQGGGVFDENQKTI